MELERNQRRASRKSSLRLPLHSRQGIGGLAAQALAWVFRTILAPVGRFALNALRTGYLYAAAGAGLAYNQIAVRLGLPLRAPHVFNQTLSNIVNKNLFKAGHDVYPGGTAGIIRATGTHINPGLQRVQALDNVLRSGGLNALDRANALTLRQDLINALATQGVKAP